jgi:hypothetical protein
VLATAVSMVASSAVATAVDGVAPSSVNGRVLMSPLALDLAIRPATARAGKWLGALVTARNIGPTELGRLSVRLRAAPGLVVRPPSSRSVRRLDSGASAILGWSLCGQHPGMYLVFAEASFGGVVVESAARLVTIKAGSGACQRRGAPSS